MQRAVGLDRGRSTRREALHRREASSFVALRRHPSTQLSSARVLKASTPKSPNIFSRIHRRATFQEEVTAWLGQGALFRSGRRVQQLQIMHRCGTTSEGVNVWRSLREPHTLAVTSATCNMQKPVFYQKESTTIWGESETCRGRNLTRKLVVAEVEHLQPSEIAELCGDVPWVTQARTGGTQAHHGGER